MNFFTSHCLIVAVGLRRDMPLVKIYKSGFNGVTLSHVHIPGGEIIDLCFLFETKNLLTLTKTNGGGSVISIFQEDKLLEFKIIKEELRRIVPSGMNPDEFLLVGARYIKLWQFLIFFDDKYEGYFRTTPSL